MLRNLEYHSTYQDKLKRNLLTLWETDKGRVVEMGKSISKLYLLNLDNLHHIIIPLYSNTGRPAENQLGIVRSLILMLDQDFHGITKWAKKVASDRLLCAICGFDYGNTPAVGSYYDFIDRIWKASKEVRRKRRKKLKSFYSKPRLKLKAGQKLPPKPKHSGATKEYAQLALNDKLPECYHEKVLQQFLARCVVDVSAQMGLLGDTKDFSISADGTPYYSGTNHRGVKVCDCQSKGIYNCKCPRRYFDIDARWGWDSYREQWFYGDNLFVITASDSPNDLPIYLRSLQASRHDSISFIFALSEVRKLYPSLIITNATCDGSMDNYPTYDLLYQWHIIPFIPLDSNSTFEPDHLPPGVLCFDDDRNPICMGGIPYQYWGYSYPKGLKYRCWFNCKGITDKPCECSNSSYGRTVYIKPDFDLRLFTPVPRNTPTWYKKMNTRTTVERSHKRMFTDYDIEAGRCRSAEHRFCRATLAAINIHLDAWIKHTGFSIVELLEKESAQQAA